MTPEMKSSTPRSDEALERDWPRFQERVRARVEQGKRDYGDSSFLRSTPEVLDELQQEIEDINGWAFLIWSRIETFRLHLAAKENT
jgi:hypothetical protein